MVYQIDRIIEDVRIAIDQNTIDAALLEEGDEYTLRLNEIIESKIEEAAERVEKEVPAHMLEFGHNFGDAPYWGDQYSGWVLLPSDFMRLVVFKMSDWEQPVYQAISADDPQYILQHQRIKALRGTPQKPVCAIVSRPQGLALEFFSCKSAEAYAEQAVYVPYPKIDSNGGIDICERCYKAVVNETASLVLTTLGEAEKSAAMSATAKSDTQ